jgi:hypothetical protein
LQWELLVHADGQRSPADLAQLLGRAGYATVQELRRLAGRGLLELPKPRDPLEDDPNFVRIPHGYGPSVDIRRPVVPVPVSAPAPVITATASRTAPSSGDPPAAAPVPVGATTGPGGERPPRLPRRKPNARLPKGVPPDDGTAPVPTGTDEMLLKRIRTALRALR